MLSLVFLFKPSPLVALNEALVLHYAALGSEIYGFNPGMIKTGIRDSVRGGGLLGAALEAAINLFNPSAAQYAATILPLLTSPDLSLHRGAMFGQKGQAILPSRELVEDPEAVGRWIEAADALAKKALSSK